MVAKQVRFRITHEVLIGVRNLKTPFANVLPKTKLPNHGKMNILLKNTTQNVSEFSTKALYLLIVDGNRHGKRII
jgi:hypothetical protein